VTYLRNPHDPYIWESEGVYDGKFVAKDGKLFDSAQEVFVYEKSLIDKPYQQEKTPLSDAEKIAQWADAPISMLPLEKRLTIAIQRIVALEQALESGTQRCPYCGESTPHRHDNFEEIRASLEAQAMKFGKKVKIVEVPDWFDNDAPLEPGYSLAALIAGVHSMHSVAAIASNWLKSESKKRSVLEQALAQIKALPRTTIIGMSPEDCKKFMLNYGSFVRADAIEAIFKDCGYVL